MPEQTIVAIYDTPAHAELAVQDLLQAGMPESAVHRHTHTGSIAGIATTAIPRAAQDAGFWPSLFGGEPDRDTNAYDRSLASGGTAVTIRVPDEHVATVMNILEQHDPIDLDEHAGAAPTQIAAEQTMRLAEETLAIGKRVVNKGTTRIHRFVVETPVEETVSLHDERVSIERHAASAARAPADAFTERTIAVTATGEEAVIAKTARVAEEIAIRKEAVQRTETVRDTLRRDDVEIARVPGDTSLSGKPT